MSSIENRIILKSHRFFAFYFRAWNLMPFIRLIYIFIRRGLENVNARVASSILHASIRSHLWSMLLISFYASEFFSTLPFSNDGISFFFSAFHPFTNNGILFSLIIFYFFSLVEQFMLVIYCGIEIFMALQGLIHNILQYTRAHIVHAIEWIKQW